MDTFTIQPWSDAKIAKFHDLLLEATASIDLPFQWIEQRAVRRLLEFLNPMDPKYFPARKTLRTTVLDRCAIRQDLNDKKELKQQQHRGGRVNLVSDSWENSARRHILGVVLNLFGVQWTYGAIECTIRQDGHSIAQSLESLLLELFTEGWNVGAVITDNAGQFNLLVKDVLSRIFGSVDEQATAMINDLSHSTSNWLPYLQACMAKVIPNCSHSVEYEQHLYLLAYFLHPHFLLEAKNFPNSEFTSPHFLSDVAIFYYKRLIDEDYGLLRSQFFRWLHGTLTSVAPDDFPTYHEYWEFLKADPEIKYNSIATIALVILSISINSATCERLFSEWGHIHTARRNRMNSQTTKKIGVVRAAVREKDRKEIIASRMGSQKKDMTTREQYISRIVDPPERERSRTNATFADVGVATESPVTTIGTYIADVEDVEEGFTGQDDEQLETASASARKVFTTWTDILQQVAEEQRGEVLLSSSVVADGGAVSEVDEEGAAGGATTRRHPAAGGGGARRINNHDAFQRPPFPEHNDPNYPQEGKLTGVRGRKMKLQNLFGSESTLRDIR
ncbi:hypothetical protein PsorP6_017535 [Peronosclerospora sorghi]|uniref:Uncharacterized protein n=1 Tax=Peronosclerospora sorghi TaxID=230839 RepID=A0ACC0WLD5_9STRA|nr:hypothetical protein PsorP6_017535 [Peronosclerospora sorghi]